MRSRRWTTLLSIVAMMAATQLMASAPAQAAERCGIDESGRTVCVAPSTMYPDVKGWYGYAPSKSPCNGGPFKDYWPAGVGGICTFSSYTVWQWTGSAWQQSSITEGTKGYVHPYTADWRWLYVRDKGWVAIRATQLSLLWYPS